MRKSKTISNKRFGCVSDHFDLKLIVRKIIESARGDSNVGDLGMEPLLKKLGEVLGGKRYFLVLDDIWEENRNKLLEDENVGRVIVTTRSENIAKFLTTKQPPIDWMAFEDGSQEVDYSTIVQTGKEIVKRCKGIPLAIKTIGNILHGIRGIILRCHNIKLYGYTLFGFEQFKLEDNIKFYWQVETLEIFRPFTELLSQVTSQFNYEFGDLQTLKLNNCLNLKELPREFEKLINLRHLELSHCLVKLTKLRYLDLSWNESLLSLPDSINDLLNLQTLKLNRCSMLKELSKDIGKLINLRHLEISDCHNWSICQVDWAS
ncbi:hypothetical protein G4B88_027685 [Cannabis sativa]|uniref:NB-ARC domain-containing protein n=1 Tax=Cannabis sativa TaxID=3483 RepID=A0A7J6ES12_CANSA|nr:hypothetical protein G4B88_027685 [Cannabis sativa]